MKAPAPKRPIALRLIHDGVQPGTPLPEPLTFGLQDSKGDVHLGIAGPGAALIFDLTLEVRGSEAAGPPIFAGAFAHGPPATRFLYLSWKRAGTHEHPWGWRIKIPLGGIGWADIAAASQPGACLLADVTGRRPHASAPVSWTVATMRPNVAPP